MRLGRILGVEAPSAGVGRGCGRATSPQRETIRQLADALGLAGLVRAQFEAVARGRPVPAVPVTGAAAAMRTLPRDIASFTGRQRELQELVNAAAGASASGGVVSIHAIGGMAGIGKTAFVVHAVHRLADRLSAGQFFLALHGHTPGQQPAGTCPRWTTRLRSAWTRCPPVRRRRCRSGSRPGLD